MGRIGLLIVVGLLTSNNLMSQTVAQKEAAVLSTHNPEKISLKVEQLNPSKAVAPDSPTNVKPEKTYVLSLKWTNDPERKRSLLAR